MMQAVYYIAIILSRFYLLINFVKHTFMYSLYSKTSTTIEHIQS